MKPFQPRLIVRADADGQIGAGHVMRCIALGQAWRRTGGEAIFVSRPLPPGIARRLNSYGFEHISLNGQPGSAADADELARIARMHSAPWIVIDGYAFRSDYHRRVLGQVNRTLLIRDDRAAVQTLATTIVNPQLFARGEFYETAVGAELLMGVTYAPLRQEFDQQSASQRLHGPCRRMLVVFGAADPNDMMSQALKALSSFEQPVHIDLVRGPCRQGTVNLACGSMPRQVNWHHDVDCLNELMSQADLAITAGGSTCYELAVMGVPMIVVAIAENQEAVGESLVKRGAAVYLGRQSAVTPSTMLQAIQQLADSPERRQSLARNAGNLIDGQGAQRIVSRMWRHMMRLRPAQLQDADLLFKWQRDKDVRRWSFSKGPENLDRHIDWFRAKLADSDSSILICETESGEPVGCVRRDRTGSHVTCGLVIDPSFRGRRLASLVLQWAIERWTKIDPNLALDAWIKPENEASRRCFRQAGFARGGIQSYLGQPAEIWTYRPNATRPTGAHFLPTRLSDGLSPDPTSIRSTV